MRICFDIDGTICSLVAGAEYEKAKPLEKTIALINSLHQSGHNIILYTARGATTHIDWRDVTEKQLEDWGVHYHELIFGKPEADVFIDDKGVNVEQALGYLRPNYCPYRSD